MRKLFLFLLLLSTFSLFSQVENVVIQWSTDNNQHFFPDALYADGENTLPYLSRKLPWTAKNMLPRVHLEVTGSTAIEDYTGYGSQIEHVKKEPLLEYELVREAKQWYVVLKVLPFQKDVSGKLERINSFAIHVEEEPALAPLKSSKVGEWTGHSVLASGNWYKIAVEHSGMHKLSYEQLQEIGLQNPASVRVYGSGARLLPEAFSKGYMDDLTSVPIYIYKGSDGLFGPGDFILFYARGPVDWTWDEEVGFYIQRLHSYSTKGYYFLTDSQGTLHAPGNVDLSTSTATHQVNSYDYLD